MRNKIILAMAAAGMMYGASYMQSIHPQQARSAQVKFFSLVPSPTHPVISHRATMRSPFRLDRFLTVN